MAGSPGHGRCGSALVLAGAAFGPVVADVNSATVGSGPIVTANAQLIAAAPDLLLECRALVDWYAALAEPGLVPASLQPILRGARAAIAKATGA